MVLKTAFISYFVWNFHSNWLRFLRVMQENKSGCFFEHSVIELYLSTTFRYGYLQVLFVANRKAFDLGDYAS